MSQKPMGKASCRSVRVDGTDAPESRGLACFRSYGEPDDHLRLAVLIADRLKDQGDPEAASQCMVPRQTWAQRLKALEAFLRTVEVPRGGFYACLVDPDALFASPLETGSPLDDVEFRPERRELFSLLVNIARERGGWVLLRCAPRRECEEALRDFQLAPGGSPSEYDVALAALVPVLRPLLAGLIRNEVITQKHAARILDVAEDEDPGLSVLAMAYDQLRPTLRDAAKWLSLLRPEQPFDGHVGPYVFGSLRAVERCLSREAVAQLLAAGFLQRGWSPSTLYMPTQIRLFLERRAEVSRPKEVLQREHQWLGGGEAGGQGVESELEAHHHAVRASDLGLALQTARYHGGELRFIGMRLFREERYREAAAAFQTIVEKFDAGDAFAWERLGSSLSRANPRPPPAIVRDVLHAYEMAVTLAPDNPRYAVRQLDFLARHTEEAVMGAKQRLLSLINARKKRSFKDEDELRSFKSSVMESLESASLKSFASELLGRVVKARV